VGIPNVPAQVRRAPFLALRTVFAGIGRIVMSAERPDCAVTDPAGRQAAASAALPQQALPSVRPVRALPQQALPSGRPAPALPMANYDSLSLPSIRARLRGLDAGQLKVLLDYEARNAERPEILRMYERRIDKIESSQ
jgi:hypothetical protein